MERRLELHSILVNLLGSENVYFQPPESYKIVYPCIVYERSNSNTKFADNLPYKRHKRYTVTVIDYDPDTDLANKVENLPLCSFDRFFVTENLNHFVYTLYY